MKNNCELNYRDLKLYCDPDRFSFKSTAELEDNDRGIGQDKAIKELEFGLNVEVRGNNLYLEGPSGVGKTMYTKRYLNKIASKRKTPCDWCYIYNFTNPNVPIAVSLPAGQGIVFKEAMDTFIKDVKADISKTFSNEDFEKEKNLIKQEFEDKRASILEKLNERAAKYSFVVKTAQNGVYMMPLYEGNALEEEDFNKLDENIRQEYEKNSSIVQDYIISAISEIKAIEKQSEKKVKEWQSNISLLTVNVHINYVKSQFKRNKKIIQFMDNVKKDILKNLQYFVHNDDDSDNKIQPTQQEVTQQKSKPWLNYRVNLFVDNSNLNGAPVIMDSNYSFQNIFGKLEYENYMGTFKTDYTMLKPGLLHIANGGYIIFQAEDLLTNSICYENLKRVLRVHEIGIDNSLEQRSAMVMVSLKPEPIPLDVKVILIGSEEIYQTLLSIDANFKKLFKLKIEFADDAPRTEENELLLARFMHSFCEEEHLPQLDNVAVARMIEYASKLADDKHKLSTRFNDLSQILSEAGTWALMARSRIITEKHVKKALAEKASRVQKYDIRMTEMIKDDILLIDTENYKVGQINGLTIMTTGDYKFGKPARITANTYTGKSGIINIEREVELSGSSHSKGVLILTGYLGELFAQDFPLSLTASICFEQLYNGVDGDSASSTELYALLSSLSGVPINQSIAVTGSVNQKGEIQPIGGVNEKIEGFYNICKLSGLDGKHGVIIPVQNVMNLSLSDDIVESVKDKKFHIYAISTIEQGIEILTGVPAGRKDALGNFPAGSVNYLAYEKLKKYAKACTN
jgi:lon-related putative ATP-dependent protease